MFNDGFICLRFVRPDSTFHRPDYWLVSAWMAGSNPDDSYLVGYETHVNFKSLGDAVIEGFRKRYYLSCPLEKL